MKKFAPSPTTDNTSVLKSYKDFEQVLLGNADVGSRVQSPPQFSSNNPGLYISNINTDSVLQDPKSYIDRKNLESRNQRTKSLEQNSAAVNPYSVLPNLQKGLNLGENSSGEFKVRFRVRW